MFFCIHKMNYLPPYYGIQLLDDIHNYFPDVLYNSGRFTNVASLLEYIQSQTRERFDRFSSAARARAPAPINRPVAPPIYRPVRRVVVPISNASGSALNTGAALNTGNLNTAIPERQLNDLLTSLLYMSGGNDITMNATFMDPINVAASADQIERSTHLRAATAQDETSRCSICQDTYTDGQAIRGLNHCNHEYHRGCIDIWLQGNVHCPICRWDIRDDEQSEERVEP